MNSAQMKYNRIIIKFNNDCHGYAITVQEGIVATFARKPTVPNNPKHSKKTPIDNDEGPGSKYEQKRLSLFVKHVKFSIGRFSIAYKVGHSKEWDVKTWYFYNITNHRNHIKWHKHKNNDCCTRDIWLKTDEGASKKITPVHHIDTETIFTSGISFTTGASVDITVLLASILNSW